MSLDGPWSCIVASSLAPSLFAADWMPCMDLVHDLTFSGTADGSSFLWSLPELCCCASPAPSPLPAFPCQPGFLPWWACLVTADSADGHCSASNPACCPSAAGLRLRPARACCHAYCRFPCPWGKLGAPRQKERQSKPIIFPFISVDK